MNEEEDRWIRGEGPPPLEIQRGFDAMRAPPPMSADIPEELERRVFAAVEADRRREARARKAKWAVAAIAALAVGAAGVAGAVVLLGGGPRGIPWASALMRSRSLSAAPAKPAEGKRGYAPVPTGSASRP
jgi:hypothetical protein